MGSIIYILEFICAFVIVYLLYKIFIIKKKKKEKDKKLTVEFNLFVKMNNIDTKKINYEKTMNYLAIINAFDIAVILLLTEITDNIIFKLLVGFVAIFALMLLSYKLFGLIYIKKGMTKDV